MSTETSPYVALTIALAVISIPTLYIYVSKRLAARKLARTGIGKNAPGFLTGVKRMAVTPEIAERLRRGEHVSPEEIAACQNQTAAGGDLGARTGAMEERSAPISETEKEEENEWLPKELTGKGKRKGPKAKRR